MNEDHEQPPAKAPALGPWPHRIVGIVGSMLLVIHFVMTALFLNPVSVVGLSSYARVVAYMEPYFHQRWTLFAPDPPLANRWVDYQCEVDGVSHAWVNRTRPLLDAHARSRFGPANRMRRNEQAAVMAIAGVQDAVLDEVIAHKERASDDRRALVELRVARETAERILGSRKLYELVADYCREDHQVEPARVRFRLITESIAPYSHRYDADWTPGRELFTSPWLAPGDFDDLEQQARDYMLDYLREHELAAPGEGLPG